MSIKKPVSTTKKTTKPAAKKTTTKKPAPRKKAVESVQVAHVEPIGEEAVAAMTEPLPSANLSPEAQANLNRLMSEASGEENPQDMPTPEEQAARQQQEQVAGEGAKLGAIIGVGMIEKAVTHFYPVVVIPDVTKVSLFESLAAVLAKYSGSGVMPPWVVQYVMPYIEELKLMGKLGALAYSVYAQVQQESQRLAEIAAAALLQQQQQQARAHAQ